MYNQFLRQTENVEEAKRLAQETWESLDQSEKDRRNAEAKAKWRETHPPAPKETPEEKTK